MLKVIAFNCFASVIFHKKENVKVFADSETHFLLCCPRPCN